MSKVKKEKVIGFRLDEMSRDRLEALSTSIGLKKSKIVRKALNEYLYRETSMIPIIFWGQNEFAFTLSCLDESQIQELANISYKNGIENTENMIRTYMGVEPSSLKLNIKTFLNVFLKYSLTDLMNWFDSAEWNWVEKNYKIRIIINHRLGKKFSQYLKYVTEYHIDNQRFMRNHKYSLTKNVLLEDLIILEFTKI